MDMLRRIAGLALLFTLWCGFANAHSGKPRFHVIIDTDGAMDDLRAITMLLSDNDVRVIAITCSQGTLLPQRVYTKVNDLLSTFHHGGIPVGIGEEVNSQLPSWNTFAREVQWGGRQDRALTDAPENAIELLNSTLEAYPSKVTLIALGSLKTYADLCRAHPKLEEKIDRIVWYNDHRPEQGFNYQISPESFEFIQGSALSFEVVMSKSDELLVDEAYLGHIRNSNSLYARHIVEVHSQASVIPKIKDQHLHLWDDLLPLYLSAPLLFDTETKNHMRFVSMNRQLPPDFIYEAVGKLLASASGTNNRVFTSFPVEAELYKPEYAKMLQETIRKFGLIEWKAIAMTNEIHGHTGIYSIIGAKMGILAMEYYNVGVNNLEVVSFAGSQPPFSCLNDGIQISTGATIGQGLITLSDTLSKDPSALFTFNRHQVRISLSADIAERIRSEIEYGVKNYGLLSDKYWLYIEDLAIKYWQEMDRHEIFDLEKLR